MIPEQQRPQFFTALCILSIALSGLSIITSLFGISNLYVPTADNQQLESTYLRLEEEYPGMEQNLKEFLNELDVYKLPNWALNFTGNCFSLMGVLMMWNFRKRGLYIYAAAEIIPLLVFTVYFIGSDATDKLGSLGPVVKMATVITIAFVLIIDGLFIFLFAKNSKQMT